MSKSLVRIVRLLFFPLTRYFDPRFHALEVRLAENRVEMAALQQRLADFETRIADEFGRRIFTDVETTIEVMLTHQRSTLALQQQIAELKGLIEAASLVRHPGSPNGRDNHLTRVEVSATEGY